MSKSEIKIKRRDVLTVGEVTELLRRLADEIDAGHSFTFDGLPITIAGRVLVKQEYKKEGREHAFSIRLAWDEKLDDQMNVDDDRQGEREESDGEGDDLPEPGVPPTPLDLPGSEDCPRMREE